MGMHNKLYTPLTYVCTKILCRPGEFNLSFPVLVVQINASERVELPENGTVSMRFDIPEVATYVYIHTLLRLTVVSRGAKKNQAYATNQ